jgi:hypothetical protein
MLSIRKSSPLLLALGTALLMNLAPAQAQSAPAPAPGAGPTVGPAPAMQPHRGDEVQHAQFRLNELQRKLSLSPEQKGAWDSWSAAELQALKQGIEQRQAWQAAHAPQGQPPAELSTPQRMAQAIAQLRDHKYLLDQHLQQLEARQVRTQAFYDTLDAKQKTIFDLLAQPGPHGPGPHGMGGPGGPGGPGAHEPGAGFHVGPGPGAPMKAPRKP